MITEQIIDSLEEILILASTGHMDEVDPNEYKDIRKKILISKDLVPFTPNYLNKYSSINTFWQFIKADLSTYAERRKYITDSLEEIRSVINQENHFETSLTSIGPLLNPPIGSGGFGQVHKITNEFIKKDFAIKVLDPLFVSENEYITAEKRFFREAEILFNLEHENIVRIYDIGMYNSKPFIKMEYINGLNLQDYISNKGTLNVERSIRLIKILMNGLSHAHEKKVIHRDLKPSNIMIGNNNVKIIDFGVSAFANGLDRTKITMTNEMASGGNYIDPYFNEVPTFKDPRSDIYSLGAIWFFILVGVSPSGSDIKDRLKKIDNISIELVQIITKCLSSSIDSRFVSIDELDKAIQNII